MALFGKRKGDDPIVADILQQQRYRLLGHAGEGGIAQVSSCFDVYLNRIVAIKRLKEDYSRFVLSAASGGSSVTYSERALEDITGQLTDLALELEDRGLLESGQTFSDEELLIFRRSGRYSMGSPSGTCGGCDNNCSCN